MNRDKVVSWSFVAILLYVCYLKFEMHIYGMAIDKLRSELYFEKNRLSIVNSYNKTFVSRESTVDEFGADIRRIFRSLEYKISFTDYGARVDFSGVSKYGFYIRRGNPSTVEWFSE